MKLILLSLILMLSACSIKEYKQTHSKIIIIKSPKLKFADLGYIRNSENAVEVELFMAGKSVKKININHLICVDEGCMSRSIFNKEYLNEAYPDELLQNILLGKPIYQAKNLAKREGGFTQKIMDENVFINYSVKDKQVIFKDKKNHILFKIKDIK